MNQPDRIGCLLGIGVGPGDPELITVKAVRALQGCDVVLVPATEASGTGAGRAEAIVLAACPEIADRIRSLKMGLEDRLENPIGTPRSQLPGRN